MVTRIRYQDANVEGTELVSVKKFMHPTNGATYQVRINKPDQAYKVVETTAGNVVAEGRAVNLHQVKIKAKNALSNLGIPFNDKETRAKV